MSTVHKFVRWELSEREFKEKITPEFLGDDLVPRELLQIMVVSDDGKTVSELNMYKSQSGEIYINRGRKFQNILNTVEYKNQITENKIIN